ncbi:MAG TPA: trehalose-phosphatase [Acidimicrobiales bacterium]|nr:trehalose-phosphatase [Acidimicrobiales bacterium]
MDWRPWVDAPSRSGVITDFDGTLAPIVDDPAAARPLRGAVGALSAVAKKLAVVAVVSGRPVDYLVQHFGEAPGLVLVGMHGLERQQNGERGVSGPALEWRPVVSRVADLAETEAPDGVEVERKGLSLTLHARGAPQAMPWVSTWAKRQAQTSGLRAQPGKMSVELLPPVQADKGTVVEELARGLQAVCFFGDDIGDLPAFAALRRLRASGLGGFGIAVASREQPEELAGAADLVVDSPEAVVEMLQTLAAALTGSDKEPPPFTGSHPARVPGQGA